MLTDLLSQSNKNKQSNTMNGVYSGIVTDNKDPKGFGRVKIKIPIINEKKEFDWVRVATLVAGQDKGTLFIPEIGDEVLVAFMMGDIKAPIVIGCLWTEKQLPEGFTDTNDIKKLKTKHGHEIIFNDKKDKAEVTIKTAKGQQMLLSEADSAITIQSSNEEQTIKLNEKSGLIEIKSGQATISLNKSGEVKISGSKAITIQGGQVKIEATSNLELKANANMTLQSSGMMQIKGSMIKLN